jgi:Fe-S-cluster containining protein
VSCRACHLPTARCCRAGLRVGLTAADVARLDPEVSLQPAPDLPGDFVAELPRRGDGSCVLLRADDACAIYAARPQACRDQDPGVCLGGAFGG